MLAMAWAILTLLAPANAANVLLIWDDDANSVENTPPLASELNAGTQALITALEAAGNTVALSNKTQHQYTALNPAPADFDAVVHLNGNTTSSLNVMKSSAVLKLLDYVQNQGGGFISSENTEAQIEIPFVGLNRAMEDLMLLDRVDGPPQPYGPMTVTKVPAQLNHPLLTGLQNQFSFTGNRMNSQLRPYGSQPATVLLTDDVGAPAAAVRDFGIGRVVTFHHAGNFRSVGNLSTTLQDPDVQQLYVNAVRWTDQKAPSLVGIERAASTPTNASNVRYTVTFSEGVDGVTPSDFKANIAGGLNIVPQIQVTELSPTQYEVRLTGLSGTGSVSLTLLNNGSIVDRSFNQNPLAGDPFTGPTYFVDAVKPVIQNFTTDRLVVLEGEKATLTFEFSEPMQTSLKPAVTIQTETNGNIAASPVGTPIEGRPDRIDDGLLVLYNFDDGGGTTVRDSADQGDALDLTIADPNAVSWGNSYLSIDAPTIIDSSGPATKLYDGVTASGALTLEAWVRPANSVQNGPARIVNYAVHSGSRNATLGQDGSNYVARVRTNETTVNGTPDVATDGGVTAGALQHVVYTRDASGATRFYIDGVLVDEDSISGEINLSTWDSTFAFALVNEFTRDRPWLGDIYLAAMYDRALAPAEITQNFAAGADDGTIGDGTWKGAFIYEVSFDRSVVDADAGTGIIRVSGARDVPGNTMLANEEYTVTLIEGGLIIVAQPPAFSYAASGSTKTLKVRVFGGVGPLNFEWFREDENNILVPVGGNADTLVLSDIDFDDAGNYYCVVTDALNVAQTDPAFIEVVASLQAANSYTIMALTACIVMLASLILLIGAAERKDD